MYNDCNISCTSEPLEGALLGALAGVAGAVLVAGVSACCACNQGCVMPGSIKTCRMECKMESSSEQDSKAFSRVVDNFLRRVSF